ncbi:Heparanase [Rhynchospora pubera]|uniref:Heparanase n=1 Tax=Rhynchospora pubera TaxID=906938 RepID=A0AAV8HC93_9POAL|nr:Heparanase [Rhynchospora pubera]
MISIETRSFIASTDHDFICATLDWWPPEKCDYGTCGWGLASILNLNLSNEILLNAVKAFSPLKIRLGGTLQDQVMYDAGDPQQPCSPFVKNSSHIFGFSEGCLPLSRWDELNDFFNKSGANIIFGLNALKGRVLLQDGSMGNTWDFSNAAFLINYTVAKNYSIAGWELGNELSGRGIGARVNVEQYVADVTALMALVNAMYQGKPARPLVLAPGGFFHSNWYSAFLDKSKPGSLDVLTHHIYNLGPGSSQHLIDEILNPLYLDGCASTFSNLQAIITRANKSAIAWVGEAGGAYNSGRHLVTDSFVFSFWYLDQLGMSAKYDTKTYCRQTLIGGNYGLLNRDTFEPNPDYYSALLWHRLMGTRVLSFNYTGSNMTRTYAHCAKQSSGITLLLINLSGNTTSQVAVTNGSDLRREEYHLTAKDGNLQSQVMVLNGQILSTGTDGTIPTLEPMIIEDASPLTVAPYSILFAHFPSFHGPACA